MTIDASGYGASPVDTGAVNVTASDWANIATIKLAGGKSDALMTLIVGSGGALGHFKLTRAASAGGLHVDWLVDTDFNTATDEMIDCVVPGQSPPNISTLAASGAGQIRLANLRSVVEVGIWAKAASTATTLQVVGAFMSSK